MKNSRNKLSNKVTTTVTRSKRFEDVKKKIMDSKGKISHAAVLQLFYDRVNNGEGLKIYEELAKAVHL